MSKYFDSCTSKTVLAVTVIFLAFKSVQIVLGHGMLLDPPNRSSLWRFPEFEKFNVTQNFNDNELFCGGFTVMFQQNFGKCGVCGDDYKHPRPRENESGGTYGKGIIVRKYKAGQVIPISVDITANHSGTFEFRLCPRNDMTLEEEECFEKYLLPFADGTGFSRIILEEEEKTGGIVNTTLTLPPNVRCSHCVLRWQYRTGNTWNACNNGTSLTGCGNQETFRNCADISIL